MRRRVKKWTRNLACALTLAMLPSMLMAVEVSEEKLVAAAKRLSEAIHDLDYHAVQELLSDELLAKEADGGKSEEEKEAQWKEGTGQAMEMMGAYNGLELAELDPPDGAFFTLRYERGSAEMFLVLNEAGKVTELNIRPLEHPTEHPEEGTAKDAEHPEKDAEHPEKAGREPITTESVAQYLETYAADEAEKQGGWLKIHDDKVGQDLELRLDMVHRERLAKTEKGTYFVCANFKTPEGKVYDLDFWVKETEEGLEVAETTLHKEEGEPRYNWIERDGVWKRIPLK